MKKTLIALAAMTAIAGAAQAQSTVTLYGVVDAGIASENNGSISKTSMNTGNLNGSRWGLKGSEDLGGGLAAVFTLEAGFNPDTGAQADAARFFNRQSFVGLTGGFGTVKLGRQMTAVYTNSGTFDPFGDALAGDTAKLLNYQGNRTDNTISYAYAASGFRGEVQYGVGEVAGSSSANRMVSGTVGYKNGPVDVVLTSQNSNNAADTDIQKVTLLGGNYDFGMAKVFLTIDKETGTGTTDLRNVVIGASAPIGAGKLMVSYIKRTNNAVANSDSKLFAIGYTYDMSKRTALYTSYGQIGNDDLATAKYNEVVAAGQTSKLFNMGVRHSF